MPPIRISHQGVCLVSKDIASVDIFYFSPFQNG
jgi:hypothetical protein